MRILIPQVLAGCFLFAAPAEALPVISVQEPVGNPLVFGSALVDFGQVGVGGYRNKVFAIANTGTTDLLVESITGVGGDVGVFVIDPFFAPTTPIPSGAQNYFQVRFSPNAEGSFSTTLRITSNDAARNPFDITLTGQALGFPAPRLVVTNADTGEVFLTGGVLDFGGVSGSEYPSVMLNIANDESADTDLILGRSLLGNGIPDFDLESPLSPDTRLAPGMSTSMRVVFHPGQPGIREDSLGFSTNDFDVGNFHLTLRGTGLFGDIAVTFPDGQDYESGLGFVEFGDVADGSSLTRTLVLRNAGGADLENFSFLITDVGPGDSGAVLSIDFPHNPELPLAPGASTPITLTLTPDSGFAAYNLQLEILTNDPDENSFVVLISGNATTAGQILGSEIADAGLTGDDALPDAIPFNDGVSNVLKYAFNMNLAGPDSGTLVPGTGTSGLPTYELDSSGPTTVVRVQYIRRKGSGLVYTPLKSGNLQTGSFEPMNGTETSESIGDFERVTVVAPCDPATEPSCFWQVRVSLP